MNCQEVMELMQRELDHDLHDAEKQTMLDHFRQCPDCAAMFERMNKLSLELEQLPKVFPPYSIVDSILPKLELLERGNGEAGAALETSAAIPGRAARRTTPWFSWKLAGGAAAAAVVLAVFFFNNAHNSLPNAEELASKTAGQNSAAYPIAVSAAGARSSSAADSVTAKKELAGDEGFDKLKPTPSPAPAESNSTQLNSAAADLKQQAGSQVPSAAKQASGDQPKSIKSAPANQSFATKSAAETGAAQETPAADAVTNSPSASPEPAASSSAAPLTSLARPVPGSDQSGEPSPTPTSSAAMSPRGIVAPSPSVTPMRIAAKQPTPSPEVSPQGITDPEASQTPAPEQDPAKQPADEPSTGASRIQATAPPNLSPDGSYSAEVEQQRVVIRNGSGEVAMSSTNLWLADDRIVLRWIDNHTLVYTVVRLDGSIIRYAVDLEKKTEQTLVN